MGESSQDRSKAETTLKFRVLMEAIFLIILPINFFFFPIIKGPAHTGKIEQ